MKFKLHHLAALAILINIPARAGDDLPGTFMTTRGKLLASEDFAKPLAPPIGKPVGFTSSSPSSSQPAHRAVILP